MNLEMHVFHISSIVVQPSRRLSEASSISLDTEAQILYQNSKVYVTETSG